MKTVLAPLLATLLLAACGGDVVTPADLGIEVDLPKLRIEGSRAYLDEPHLLIVQVGESMTTPDREELQAAGKKASLLVCMGADAPAWDAVTAVIRFGIWDGWPRFHVAAQDRASGVVALPWIVNPSLEEELTRVGFSLIPNAIDPHGAFELRITRTESGVRYRWRRAQSISTGPRPWDLGDVTLTDAELAQEGDAPILPSLAKTLEERYDSPVGPRTLVSLEMGRGVRARDFVAALECGRCSPDVFFIPRMHMDLPGGILRILRQDLPVPPPELEKHLQEVIPEDGWFRVPVGFPQPAARVNFDGPAFAFRGKLFPDAERLPLPSRRGITGLYFTSDREVPFRLLLPQFRRADREGWAVRLRFEDEDPGFLRERSIEVPLAEAGADAIVLTLEDARGELREPRGKAVRLLVPANAKTGPVFQAALALTAAGVTGIRFDLLP